MLKPPSERPYDGFHFTLLHDDPLSFAQDYWNEAVYIDDFADACRQATTNKDVYDKLWLWALEQDNLPADRKIALYDALVRKPPRKGIGGTSERHEMIRTLGAILVNWYVLPPSADRRHPAASIIAQIEGCNISEGRISNILYTKTLR
jgi:hypothetical protein